MGLELDAGGFLGLEEIAGGGDSDAGDDNRVSLHDLDPGTRVWREVYGGGIVGEGDEDGGKGLEADSADISEIEVGTGDRGATTASHAPTSRGIRSAAGKRKQNKSVARRRRVAMERRALKADGPANEDATEPSGSSL
jgi:hypothetical protein